MQHIESDPDRSTGDQPADDSIQSAIDSGSTDDPAGGSDQLLAIDPAPHELSGNLIFTADTLRPYFAFDSVVKDVDGAESTTIDFDGDRYELQLYHEQSGLKPPADPDFDFRLESVREFRIKFKIQDDVGQKSGSFHIAPRWPDMESKGDSPTPSTPDITGVNIRVDGSNLAIDKYSELLRQAADAFDINSGYFADSKIHRYSNIWQFEYYVRINRDRADRITGSGGPLRRIFHHVESDGGFRELREDNRDSGGDHHRVQVDSDGAGKLLAGHELGKKIKLYDPKHPPSNADNPLYHPKLGVSLKTNINANGSVPWRDRARLERECDELLLNILSWSGLSTRADPSVYISDAYFDATESTRSRRLIDDPTPAIKRKQETVVIDGLTANPDLNESDRDTLVAMTDGGTATPDDLADETGYSKRTVYRVIDRLEDILRSRAGFVEFASEYLADTVRSTLAGAKEAIERDNSNGGTSPWKRFVNAHGVDVDDPTDGRLKLRFGRLSGGVDRDLIEAGLRAWTNSGRNRRRFEYGKARWESDGRMCVRTPLLRR